VGIWSWSADELSFHPDEAGFYKPTVLEAHPNLLQDYNVCNIARLILKFSLNVCFHVLIKMHEKWSLNLPCLNFILIRDHTRVKALGVGRYSYSLTMDSS
jgi:hypothetical protein